MKKFTYSDSEAGSQVESFDTLSEIVKYIEDFDMEGESTGIIYQNNEPILLYVSKTSGLNWEKIGENDN